MSTTSHIAEQRFSEIVRTYGPALQAYSTRLAGGDAGWAEDIVQETFIRAWQRLDRLTPEYGSVNGWLRRVANNLVIDGHRMRRARPLEIELGDLALAARNDGLDNVLTAMLVEQALSGLWPEHRAVLVEVFLHDRSPAQTAEILGIPLGTVKSRLHYALRALRGVADTDLLAS